MGKKPSEQKKSRQYGRDSAEYAASKLGGATGRAVSAISKRQHELQAASKN
jgi:hypothetical protein